MQHQIQPIFYGLGTIINNQGRGGKVVTLKMCYCVAKDKLNIMDVPKRKSKVQWMQKVWSPGGSLTPVPQLKIFS